MKVGEIMQRILHAYDIMAFLCHKIRLLSVETQRGIYRSYWANPELAKLEIENTFCFFNRRHTDRDFLYTSLTIDEIDILVDKIEIWCNTESDNKYLLYLLIYFDGYILFERSADHFFETIPNIIPHTCYFDCLNSNELECWGKLLPRFEPEWAKSNSRRRSSLSEDPLSIMQHYFWVENTDPWEIDNVYSPRWTCTAGSAYTIVCSPLTNRPTFTYSEVPGDDCNYFNITKYHDEDQQLMLERFEKALAFANSKKANILLFPEMIASPECQQKSVAITKKHWEFSHPRILCLPSSEFKEDGEWKNQTIILNDSGREVFRYNKKQPFQLDDKIDVTGEDGVISKHSAKFFEPINPDHKLTVMHVKGLGRIGVIICADIFNSELCNILLEKYEIRLLLIMAYTAGYDQFFREIAAAKTTSCDVVWCNTCAAYTASNKTGPAVAYFSYGHKHGDEKIIPHCRPKDDTLCAGCVSTITINPIYSHPGSIHSEPLC